MPDITPDRARLSVTSLVMTPEVTLTKSAKAKVSARVRDAFTAGTSARVRAWVRESEALIPGIASANERASARLRRALGVLDGKAAATPRASVRVNLAEIPGGASV